MFWSLEMGVQRKLTVLLTVGFHALDFLQSSSEKATETNPLQYRISGCNAFLHHTRRHLRRAGSLVRYVVSPASRKVILDFVVEIGLRLAFIFCCRGGICLSLQSCSLKLPLMACRKPPFVCAQLQNA